jgi:hypothetical protein
MDSLIICPQPKTATQTCRSFLACSRVHLPNHGENWMAPDKWWALAPTRRTREGISTATTHIPMGCRVGPNEVESGGEGKHWARHSSFLACHFGVLPTQIATFLGTKAHKVFGTLEPILRRFSKPPLQSSTYHLAFPPWSLHLRGACAVVEDLPAITTQDTVPQAPVHQVKCYPSSLSHRQPVARRHDLLSPTPPRSQWQMLASDDLTVCQGTAPLLQCN